MPVTAAGHPPRVGRLHPAAWLLCCLGTLATPALQAAQPGLLVGRVSRVLDGDSLRLQQGGRSVELRLAAIDAPELDQAHGRAAHRALQSCALGRLVTVRVLDRDRHGRSVGVLEVEGRDCGLRQLENGQAWHAQAHDRDLARSERLAYARAERTARRNRLGLWADADPTPPWEHRRRGQDARRP